jgi:alpha-glucosidase (family GH31 glycosyl hydrolase)
VEQFYELWGGEPLQTYEIVNFAVVLADLPLFIRAGHIVPIRLVDSGTLSAESARQQPLSLIAALDESNNHQAIGKFMPNHRITMDLQLDARYVSLIYGHCASSMIIFPFKICC